MAKEFICLTTLASMMHLKPGTISKYRKTCPSKIPPAYKFSGRPMWDRQEVEEWLASRKEGFNV